jgi:hypothetical protein
MGYNLLRINKEPILGLDFHNMAFQNASGSRKKVCRSGVFFSIS